MGYYFSFCVLFDLFCVFLVLGFWLLRIVCVIAVLLIVNFEFVLSAVTLNLVLIV